MASGRNTFPLPHRVVCFVIFEIYVDEESFENRFRYKRNDNFNGH